MNDKEKPKDGSAQVTTEADKTIEVDTVDTNDPAETSDTTQSTPEPLVTPSLTPTSSPAPADPTPTPAKVTTSIVPNKKPRSKLILPALVAAGLLVLGGGAFAYFGVYLQSPQQIWNQALTNTASGYKKLAKTKPSIKKGVKVSGTFKSTQPIASDGSISLHADDKNFTFVADAGASGARANVELRGVQSAGTSPDLFVKLGGVKGVGSLLGTASQTSTQLGSLLTNIDEKWFFVDHTLLDQMATSDTSGQIKSITTENPQQLQNDIYDIHKKVSNIVADRLLSTDPKKAAVLVKDNLGKESFKGKSSQHYRVKVQKQQFRDMIVALKDTLKDSKLKDWLGANNKNKTFERAINFDQLLKDIDNAHYDNIQPEVWVDTNTKLIRDVRFNYLNSDNKNVGTMDFFMDYSGGNELPLQIKLTSTDKANSGTVNFGIIFNQKTNVIKLNTDINTATGQNKIAGTANFTLEGSDDIVKVEKPTISQNLLDLLAPLLAKYQSKR